MKKSGNWVRMISYRKLDDLKVGDWVLFYPDEERDYVGNIVVIDDYGTLCDPTQVYYDIEMQDGSWYKHVPESLVEKIEDIKAGRDADVYAK